MQQHFCVRIREKLMVCFQERSDFQGKHITELKLFMRFVSHTRKRNFYDLCSGNASFQLFKVPRMPRKQIFLMKSRVTVFLYSTSHHLFTIFIAYLSFYRKRKRHSEKLYYTLCTQYKILKRTYCFTCPACLEFYANFDRYITTNGFFFLKTKSIFSLATV